MERWAIVFSISFLINFGTVYIWPIYQSLDKRVWFTILFFSSQRELSSSKYWLFFLLNYDLFCPSWSCQGQNYQILTENCNHAICLILSILFLYSFLIYFLIFFCFFVWLFEKFNFKLEASYSFKITCILVKQVIYLKKNALFLQ